MSCASFGTPLLSIARVCAEIQPFLLFKGTNIGWGPMVTGAVKGEVKGGGEEQFELLLVLIDALEEPSDLVWL